MLDTPFIESVETPSFLETRFQETCPAERVRVSIRAINQENANATCHDKSDSRYRKRAAHGL